MHFQPSACSSASDGSAKLKACTRGTNRPFFPGRHLRAHNSPPNSNTRPGARTPAEAFLGSWLENVTDTFLALGYVPGRRGALLWSQAGLTDKSLFGTLAVPPGETIHHGIPMKKAQKSAPRLMLTPHFLKIRHHGEKRGHSESGNAFLLPVLKGPQAQSCIIGTPEKLALEKETGQGGLITAPEVRHPSPAGPSHHLKSPLVSGPHSMPGHPDVVS